MKPAHLDRNQPPGRFYRGGARIAAFREVAVHGEFEPEDWVGSTTEVTGEPGLGLSVLPDGRLLRDAIAADPVAWLGAEHVAAFGEDTEVLTKLLDAGERLPVHIHPSREFSEEHLGLTHGKAEAWVYLTDGEAHIGFLPEVTRDQVLPLLRAGETAPVLELMHQLTVTAGDVVYCPPGIPHAIGSGSFMVEVQEPADLSIFLEWKDFPLPGGAGGHLGLDDETAAGAVVAGIERAVVDQFVSAGGGTTGDLLDGANAPFRVDRLRAGDEIEAGFAVLIVTAGAGRAKNESGDLITLDRGSAFSVPHVWGSVTIDGLEDLEVIVARPPNPA
ncbi:carbohydrate kinase [Brachybacterium sacelli]|uniref:Mannose-6-phosphate isomerase n=1 Tax=Brachybacterium sacelli TaxID=173364 RepID=A0ABS4WZ15_9MICO|nr:carbohydrate kinase [Brachybacterium sacelli]MBP2381454.1 mannose-6-phosphate isomerase [Brachybacterium sacelli]